MGGASGKTKTDCYNDVTVTLTLLLLLSISFGFVRKDRILKKDLPFSSS